MNQAKEQALDLLLGLLITSAILGAALFVSLLLAGLCGAHVEMPPGKELAWKIPVLGVPLTVLGHIFGLSGLGMGLFVTLLLLRRWFRLGLGGLLATVAAYALLVFWLLPKIIALVLPESGPEPGYE